MTRKLDRLGDIVRTLNLVAYFQSHEGRSIMAAAQDLGVSPQQLLEDTNRLWVCGRPGGGPGDLIDMTQPTYAGVHIIDSQGMDQPLRLTATEAGTLLLVLEALEQLPGLVDSSAVTSAAEKLRAIAPESAGVFDSHADATPDSRLRDALAEQRVVEFHYVSAGDEATNRRVHPARIFTHGGEVYLVGWDERAQSHRNFRLDRISQLKVLPEPADPRRNELEFDDADPFNFKVTPQAELQLHESLAWLAEYYPMELGDRKGEWISATLPLAEPEWVVRFCLGYGGHIRVTAPDTLAASVRERAKVALAEYDGPHTSMSVSK